MVNEVVGWLAPIASTLIVCAGQLALNTSFKRVDEKHDAEKAETDAKRKAEAEWRDDVTRRLDDMEAKLNRSVAQQAVDIRSDIVHKCHRYLDDLGRASSEEKEVLNDAYEHYCAFCADLDIENDFIDQMVARVMELPERDI